MSTDEEFKQLELEFAAFLRRPGFKNFAELLNILRRVFPIEPIPVSGPPEPIDDSAIFGPSQHSFEWLPKAPLLPSMPPREHYAEPPSGTSQEKSQPGDNDAHAHPHSMAENPPGGGTPFSNHGGPHTILPPLSAMLQQPLGPPLSMPSAAYNPTAAPGPGNTFYTYPSAYSTAPSFIQPAAPSFLQPAAPSFLQPAAPSYTQPAASSFVRPAPPLIQPTAPVRSPFTHFHTHMAQPSRVHPSHAAHNRTGSIISAYSNPGSENSHAATLTSSVASGMSSDPVLTPDTSSAGRGQGIPWQTAHARSVGSTSSAPQVPEVPKLDLGSHAAFALPRSQHDLGAPAPSSRTSSILQPPPLNNAGPPLPPMQEPNQVPPNAAIAPPGSAPDQYPGADIEDEGDDVVAALSMSIATRAGGPAYVLPEDRPDPVRTWRVHEDGFLLVSIFGPEEPGAPARLAEALAPSNGRSDPSTRRVFRELAASERFFNNTRTPEVIYERFLRLRGYFIDINRYRRRFPHRFEDYDDEYELLQEIHVNIKTFASEGVRIKLSAWRVLVYVRESWYHWLRISPIAELPSAQTTTSYRSGNLSPVSAPSRLPAQPSASSRSVASMPAPSQAPPSLGSSNGSRSRGRPPAQRPRAPTQGNKSGSGSRNLSASSFRAPREPSSGRVARTNLSGSAGSRPSKNTRSNASNSAPAGQTPGQSESSSATGLSRASGSPADASAPARAEFIRSAEHQLREMTSIRGREADESVRAIQATAASNERMNQLAMRLMEASFDLNQAEGQQRMYYEDQRAQLEAQRMQNEIERRNLQIERLALEHVAAQMSMSSAQQASMITDSPYYPPESGPQPLLLASPPQTSASAFSALLDRARAHIMQSYNYPVAPLSLLPPPSYSHPASFMHVREGQAGPSSHPNQYHEFPSAIGHSSVDSRFEDMGTVTGTPRMPATGDELDVEGMDLRDDEQGNEQDSQGHGKGKMPENPRKG